MIAGDAFVVGLVARVGQVRNVQIGDDDCADVLRPQILDHLIKNEEAVRVNGEWTSS